MYPELLKKVKSSGLIEAGDRIVVGVSGGVDSVVLLDALTKLQQEYDFELCVAHVNYGLRGKESDRDERFVRVLAKEYGVKCFVKINPPQPPFCKGGGGGISPKSNNLQNMARNIRYDFFLKTAKKFKANKIAIAHHADDQAETILQHLIRGSGLNGLIGMAHTSSPPLMGGDKGEGGIVLIRPLLDTTREEIEHYAGLQGLKFVEDSTNRTKKYHRNVIRHEMMPMLKKYNSNIVRHLCKTAAILRDENDVIDEMAAIAFERSHYRTIEPSNQIAFKRLSFIKYSIAIRRRILRLAYAGLTGGTKDLLTDHVEHMLQIIESTKKVGAYSLPHKVKFIRKMGKISLVYDV